MLERERGERRQRLELADAPRASSESARGARRASDRWRPRPGSARAGAARRAGRTRCAGASRTASRICSCAMRRDGGTSPAEHGAVKRLQPQRAELLALDPCEQLRQQAEIVRAASALLSVRITLMRHAASAMPACTASQHVHRSRRERGRDRRDDQNDASWPRTPRTTRRASQ